MIRFVFFLLLIVAAMVGGGIYLVETRPALLPGEVNPGALKIVAKGDAASARQSAEETRKIADGLAGAACVSLAVRAADGGRAQATLAGMQLGNRLTTMSIEEFTRFGVSLPPQRDKRAVDAVLAGLKKGGVKDFSAMPDLSVSLGVFSSEEAAKRSLAELEAKVPEIAKNASINPRSPQLREVSFVIGEPDAALNLRLAILQREFAGSVLKAATCLPKPAPDVKLEEAPKS